MTSGESMGASKGNRFLPDEVLKRVGEQEAPKALVRPQEPALRWVECYCQQPHPVDAVVDKPAGTDRWPMDEFRIRTSDGGMLEVTEWQSGVVVQVYNRMSWVRLHLESKHPEQGHPPHQIKHVKQIQVWADTKEPVE